ncbi:MAG: hypothetical protein KDA87_15440 [Planctomycetales bacterium]|nr:hypothetical protein [Planctomycetales bacterium]
MDELDKNWLPCAVKFDCKHTNIEIFCRNMNNIDQSEFSDIQFKGYEETNITPKTIELRDNILSICIQDNPSFKRNSLYISVNEHSFELTNLY